MTIFFAVISLPANAQKIDRLDFEQVKVEEITALNLTKITNDKTFHEELRTSLDGKKISFKRKDQTGFFILDLETKQEKMVRSYEAGFKVEPTPVRGGLLEKDNKILIIDNNGTKVIAPWGKKPEVLKDGNIRYEIDEPRTFIVFDGFKRSVQNREGSPPIFIESPEITCSPDGVFIVRANTKEDDFNIIGSNLEIRKIGEKKGKKIFDNPKLIPLYPDWSSDGSKIFFIDEKKGQIYSLDIKISK